MSRRPALHDITDHDDRIARPAFLVIFLPVLTGYLHGSAARVAHRARRCPEAHLHPSFGLTLCARCADLVDGYLDARYRRWRSVLESPARPTPELASLLRYLDSAPARAMPAQDAAAVLLVFSATSAMDLPGWAGWAFFHVVVRPRGQIVADLGRQASAALGGSARPDRDLLTARWAAAILPDPAQRAAVAEFVVRLRSGDRDPRRHLPDDARARLPAALDALRRDRPEFYNANVALPMTLRDQVVVTNDEQERGQPMWGRRALDSPTGSLSTGEPVHRLHCRARLAALLADRSTGAGRLRRLIRDFCDVGFGRRSVDLRQSVERLMGPPTPDGDRLIELGHLVTGAGLGWAEDLLVAASGAVP